MPFENIKLAIMRNWSGGKLRSPTLSDREIDSRFGDRDGVADDIEKAVAGAALAVSDCFDTSPAVQVVKRAAERNGHNVAGLARGVGSQAQITLFGPALSADTASADYFHEAGHILGGHTDSALAHIDREGEADFFMGVMLALTATPLEPHVMTSASAPGDADHKEGRDRSFDIVAGYRHAFETLLHQPVDATDLARMRLNAMLNSVPGVLRTGAERDAKGKPVLFVEGDAWAMDRLKTDLLTALGGQLLVDHIPVALRGYRGLNGSENDPRPPKTNQLDFGTGRSGDRRRKADLPLNDPPLELRLSAALGLVGVVDYSLRRDARGTPTGIVVKVDSWRVRAVEADLMAQWGPSPVFPELTSLPLLGVEARNAG